MQREIGDGAAELRAGFGAIGELRHQASFPPSFSYRRAEVTCPV